MPSTKKSWTTSGPSNGVDLSHEESSHHPDLWRPCTSLNRSGEGEPGLGDPAGGGFVLQPACYTGDASCTALEGCVEIDRYNVAGSLAAVAGYPDRVHISGASR